MVETFCGRKSQVPHNEGIRPQVMICLVGLLVRETVLVCLEIYSYCFSPNRGIRLQVVVCLVGLFVRERDILVLLSTFASLLKQKFEVDTAANQRSTFLRGFAGSTYGKGSPQKLNPTSAGDMPSYAWWYNQP